MNNVYPETFIDRYTRALLDCTLVPNNTKTNATNINLLTKAQFNVLKDPLYRQTGSSSQDTTNDCMPFLTYNLVLTFNLDEDFLISYPSSSGLLNF